ncbi:hypothetical protein D3C72_1911830 [compost metagenome]
MPNPSAKRDRAESAKLASTPKRVMPTRLRTMPRTDRAKSPMQSTGQRKLEAVSGSLAIASLPSLPHGTTA